MYLEEYHCLLGEGELVRPPAGVEDELFKILEEIPVVVSSIVNADKNLFHVAFYKNGWVQLKATIQGMKLLNLLKIDQSVFSFHFPLCDFDPYVSLFFMCSKRVEDPWLLPVA